MQKEEKFKKELVTMMRARCCHVQQIESHATGRGIPDLYIETPFGNNWWELKAVHGFINLYTTEIVVEWRAGQQSWMSLKYKASNCERPCWTFIESEDKYVIAICNNQVFTGNKVIVDKADVVLLRNVKELASQYRRFVY